jgi:hypothetical protein
MKLLNCHRFFSALSITEILRIVEWAPLFSGRAHSRPGFVSSVRDFIYPWREEQIVRYSIDRPGADRLALHNTSRQKCLPSLIDEERQ